MTASWLLADQASPQTDMLLDRLNEGPALVPNLWHLEVGNVLAQSERRGPIDASQSTSCLELLSRLPIEVERLRLGTP